MLTLRYHILRYLKGCFGVAGASCLSTLCIALLLSPLSLSSQNSFSLSADVDGAAGDQRVTAVEVSPEATVSIQVYASDVSQAQGVSIRLVYDAGQVVYDGTDAGDLFPNAQVLVETGVNPTSVTLGVASMGGRAAATAGLVGTVRFRTSATFTGTTIRFVEATLGRGGQQETLMPDVNIVLRPLPAGPSPDFDGDGTVGFTDFVQFAGNYGTQEGDGTYDARFDLDGDGNVGFSDFLALAGLYGQEVAPPTPTAPDRDVLVALYNATGGDNWTTQTNWLTDNPLETWHGVTVANGRVTGISLSENKLKGRIPPELGTLTYIDSLKLDRNALKGTIPVELGNLENLTKLELFFNELSGPIPAELGNLGELTWLFIGFNPLGGQIPVELGNLANLRVLLLNGSQLTGPVPAELAELSNLESLWLNANELSGPIPPGLGNLTNLWALSLAANQLTGSIPEELGKLTKLQRFFLGNNQLTGAIPAELGNLTILPVLSLSDNNLSGTIPSELGNLANLVALNLHRNDLSGPIPTELGKLSKLEFLQVNNNESLTGTLPESLTGLTDLTRFYFDGTGLCAPVDAAFQQWLQAIEDSRGANCQ